MTEFKHVPVTVNIKDLIAIRLKLREIIKASVQYESNPFDYKTEIIKEMISITDQALDMINCILH